MISDLLPRPGPRRDSCCNSRHQEHIQNTFYPGIWLSFKVTDTVNMPYNMDCESGACVGVGLLKKAHLFPRDIAHAVLALALAGLDHKKENENEKRGSVGGKRRAGMLVYCVLCVCVCVVCVKCVCCVCEVCVMCVLLCMCCVCMLVCWCSVGVTLSTTCTFASVDLPSATACRVSLHTFWHIN